MMEIGQLGEAMRSLGANPQEAQLEEYMAGKTEIVRPHLLLHHPTPPCPGHFGHRACPSGAPNAASS